MKKVNVTFLDQLHPWIEKCVRDSVPDNWVVTFDNGAVQGGDHSAVAHADVLLLIGASVPGALVEAAPNLKLVQKLGVGTDKIDCSACAAHDVAVARVFGGNAVPVAEHTLMLILSTLRRLPAMDASTRSGGWLKEEARSAHRQIHGRQVGLVGFGQVGRAVARLLLGFGANVVYCDPVAPPESLVHELSVTPMALDELLATSDIVSLHVPLDDGTRGMIDRRRLGLMKKDAILVNCARGGVVDEAALAEALRAGTILGAGVDVFSVEPPVGSPLLDIDNVVLSPHIAGATIDNFREILARGIRNVESYLTDGALPPGDAVHNPKERG